MLSIKIYRQCLTFAMHQYQICHCSSWRTVQVPSRWRARITLWCFSPSTPSTAPASRTCNTERGILMIYLLPFESPPHTHTHTPLYGRGYDATLSTRPWVWRHPRYSAVSMTPPSVLGRGYDAILINSTVCLFSQDTWHSQLLLNVLCWPLSNSLFILPYNNIIIRWWSDHLTRALVNLVCREHRT